MKLYSVMPSVYIYDRIYRGATKSAVIRYAKDFNDDSDQLFTMNTMQVYRALTTVCLILAINHNHFTLLRWCLDKGLNKWLRLCHVDVLQLLSIGRRLPRDLAHQIIAAFQTQTTFNKAIALISLALPSDSVYHQFGEIKPQSHIQQSVDDSKFVKNLLSDERWDIHGRTGRQVFFQLDSTTTMDEDGVEVGGQDALMNMVNDEIENQFVIGERHYIYDPLNRPVGRLIATLHALTHNA